MGSGGRAAAVSPARGSGSAGTPMGWKGAKPALRNRRIGPKLSTELSGGFLELLAILLSVCLQPPFFLGGLQALYKHNSGSSPCVRHRAQPSTAWGRSGCPQPVPSPCAPPALCLPERSRYSHHATQPRS